MASEQLHALLGKEKDGAGQLPPNVSQRWLALGFPWALLLGFLIVLGLLFGERMLPARPVSIVSVVTLAQASDASVETIADHLRADPFAAPVAFQASGWLEPDPLPVKVTALVSGVVDQVYVLEGDLVEQGQIIATLIADDMRLNVATAQASVQAEHARLAANAASIQVMEARINVLGQHHKAAQALYEMRLDAAERMASAGRGVVKEIDIVESRQLAIAQEAEVAASALAITEAQAEIVQLKSAHDKIKADIALAETDVARQQLAMERTQIRAPMDGRVMRLLVQPGQQRMLGADNRDSAAIAYLYDPEKLQARIDVPLAEAAKMSLGQPVRLRSNFLPDMVFHGTVSRITGEADLQRNTLQAKVAIIEPDHRLRPGMLCRAEFLDVAPLVANAAASPPAAPSHARVFVPTAALLDRTQDSADVWLMDASSEHVARQRIRLGAESRAGHVLVLQGLRPGDRVVVHPPADLVNGARVTRSQS